jgi:hypothetical protein
MLLLYCANGIVVAAHEDTQNVPKTAYEPGTRIIPWREALGDLAKVGTPPDPAMFMGSYVDPRPYAEPVETKQTLLDYAAQVRWETSTQGIPFTAASGTVPANSDRLSQTLIDALATHAQTLAPTDLIDFTQNNQAYQITAQEAINLNTQVQTLIQNARSTEAACIVDLNLATPTILTYADVEARFSGLRSKALKK